MRPAPGLHPGPRRPAPGRRLPSWLPARLLLCPLGPFHTSLHFPATPCTTGGHVRSSWTVPAPHQPQAPRPPAAPDASSQPRAAPKRGPHHRGARAREPGAEQPPGPKVDSREAAGKGQSSRRTQESKARASQRQQEALLSPRLGPEGVCARRRRDGARGLETRTFPRPLLSPPAALPPPPALVPVLGATLVALLAGVALSKLCPGPGDSGCRLTALGCFPDNENSAWPGDTVLDRRTSNGPTRDLSSVSTGTGWGRWLRAESPANRPTRVFRCPVPPALPAWSPAPLRPCLPCPRPAPECPVPHCSGQARDVTEGGPELGLANHPQTRGRCMTLSRDALRASRSDTQNPQSESSQAKAQGAKGIANVPFVPPVIETDYNGDLSAPFSGNSSISLLLTVTDSQVRKTKRPIHVKYLETESEREAPIKVVFTPLFLILFSLSFHFFQCFCLGTSLNAEDSQEHTCSQPSGGPVHGEAPRDLTSCSQDSERS